MPQQVLELGPAWVKSQGFALPVDQLWNQKKGSGLLSNAIALPGCSGAFVSANGLLITNHHCVASILQQHSTPEANLARVGYLARTQGDEKPAAAFRIQVPRGFRDVTQEVLALVPTDADDLQRFRAIETAQKSLVAECEKKPDTRCTFAAFDGGRFYTLMESLELTDVRLVYAPAHSIGQYGGDIDNWMWPRHNGDFALVRAYQNGKPYRPEYFFPLSTRGVKPGDGIAVLGYPGSTSRALVAEEMEERERLFFPRMQGLTAEWQGILERAGAARPEAMVAVSDDLQSLLNRRKNAEGQLAGLARGHIVDKARQSDERVAAWVAKHPEQQAALAARAGLQQIARDRQATWERDFLLDALGNGPRGLRWGVMLARRTGEAAKPDAEREPGFQERDLSQMRDRLERDQKRYEAQVDQALMLSWVTRARALPAEQKIAAVQQQFGALVDEAAVKKKIAELYAASKLFELAQRKQMFDEAPQVLRARVDPLLQLAVQLDDERKLLKDRRDRWNGAVSRFRPAWRSAVISEAGKPIAPDANSTLRVSFGRVKGYSPRDALVYSPQTKLSGVVEKYTGVEPFELPANVLEAARAGRMGKWKDAALGDVPVDFLGDCDTTGGNSGSPVINGQGQLVGVNFDRVWENVANDFGYNPDVARNVMVDARYLLWLLDEVEHAAPLVDELSGKTR